MQNLIFYLVLMLIATIFIALLFFLFLYLIKGKEAVVNVIKYSIKYLIYILCVMAQKVEYADGKTKKKFVVEIINRIIYFIDLKLTSIKIPFFDAKIIFNNLIDNLNIEELVQLVYNEYEKNIKKINKHLISQIDEISLFKEIKKEIKADIYEKHAIYKK